MTIWLSSSGKKIDTIIMTYDGEYQDGLNNLLQEFMCKAGYRTKVNSYALSDKRHFLSFEPGETP